MPILPSQGSGSSGSGSSGSGTPGAGAPGSGALFGGSGSADFREVATSFGTDAQRYDRARPTYPGAMVERLLAESPGHGSGARAGSGARGLDVGCGTGIVARLFQAAGG